MEGVCSLISRWLLEGVIVSYPFLMLSDFKTYMQLLNGVKVCNHVLRLHHALRLHRFSLVLKIIWLSPFICFRQPSSDMSALGAQYLVSFTKFHDEISIAVEHVRMKWSDLSNSAVTRFDSIGNALARWSTMLCRSSKARLIRVKRCSRLWYILLPYASVRV